MSDNAQLVRDYMETVWNEGLTDKADAFLAEDLAQHNPNLPDGRDPLVAFIDQFRAKMPDGHFDVRRVAAAGELVFTHSLFTTGPGDRGSVVVDVYRVVDGLIVEHWDVHGEVPESTASGREVV